MSHAQADTAALAESLRSALVDNERSVWFDVKMEKRGEDAMKEGVENSDFAPPRARWVAWS